MKFRDDIAEGNGPSNFIKLKDGESISGICRGEPFEQFVIWENKVKTVVPEGTPGSKLNFKINFVVKEGTSYVAKVLEGGAQIYKQLAALSKEWDLDQTVIIIRRDGIELNTEYTVMPAPPKQQAPGPALEFIASMELNDLDPQPEPPAPAPKTAPKNHAPGAKARF
jgi:hypothetical protein